MKVTLQLEINSEDRSALLFEDVERALERQLSFVQLAFYDASLGRFVDATISVEKITQ